MRVLGARLPPGAEERSATRERTRSIGHGSVIGDYVLDRGGIGSFENKRTLWVIKRVREGADARRIANGNEQGDYAASRIAQRGCQTKNLICGCGGIGRRARFRILCSFVQVQVLSPVPNKKGAFAPFLFGTDRHAEPALPQASSRQCFSLQRKNCT